MKHRKRLSILLILTLVFIWGNSLLPGTVSGAISDGLMEILNTAADRLGLGPDFFTFMQDQNGDGVMEPTSLILRKAAHLTEFAVLAMILRALYGYNGGKPALSALCTAACCGAVDELIQIWSHRGSQVTDVLIDTLGAMLGLCLAWVYRRLREKSAGPEPGTATDLRSDGADSPARPTDRPTDR